MQNPSHPDPGPPSLPGHAATPGIPADAGGPDPAGDAGYALLDVGGGRRLERFGDVVVDRPAPAAVDLAPMSRAGWGSAAASFARTDGGGAWHLSDGFPRPWTVELDGVTLELRPTPAGQVGCFPEHAGPARRAAAAASLLATRLGRPAEVLNLFGYTGLATLVLARAGARVVHVDASRPAVAWARRNAARSGLDRAPVRWLVEDAAAFVEREIRRGRRYDALVLDPPTYGHAPRGAAWRLDEGLAGLLAGCARLTGPEPGFVLLTAHTAGLRASDLRAAVEAAWGPAVGRRSHVEPLALVRSDGVSVPLGHALWVGP